MSIVCIGGVSRPQCWYFQSSVVVLTPTPFHFLIITSLTAGHFWRFIVAGLDVRPQGKGFFSPSTHSQPPSSEFILKHCIECTDIFLVPICDQLCDTSPFQPSICLLIHFLFFIIKKCCQPHGYFLLCYTVNFTVYSVILLTLLKCSLC